MRRFWILGGGFVLAASVALSSVAFSQEKPGASAAGMAKAGAEPGDPLVVAPSMYKLKMENERVRVMEVTFKPGQKIPPHKHPDHLVYALMDGALTITPAGGKPNMAKFKKGDTVWIPAESHSAVNTGGSEIKLLVIELK